MDFLIEIVLFAAAAYGVKSYFFKPATLKNTEAFSSRGANFVKRLVNEQIMPRCENSSNIAQKPEPLAVEESATPPAFVVETSKAPENFKQQAAKQSTVNSQPKTANLSVPEDSMLKRHFLAQLTAEQIALTNPYPTDSVLRRHYDQQQIASLSVTPMTITSATTMKETTNQTAPETHPPRLTIPEDSVLKRHFLAAVQNKLEQQHPPRPSDAVLKRHHNQLIQSHIEAYLAESAA